MSRGWLAAGVLSAFVVLALPVTANHPQSAPGVSSVVFDHLKGNEWWVEVKVSASAPIDAVDARIAGRYAGAFTTNSPIDGRLRMNEWGAWVGSFHIPAGSRVEFLAYQNGGMSAVWQAASCPFTHPAGVEQCGTTSSSTTTTTGGTFNAPFTGFRGNEWWVQANVGTSGPAIAKVDVRIAPDGAWKPLAKQSWGPTAWAASYHFPQGSILQMRATATTGQTDLSSCRQWIPPSGQDAAIVTCPGTTPPTFDATWSNVKGNEYWVEAVVKANAPVQMVLLMIDCETQTDQYDMTYRADWGKWVLGSINIPAGSVITMTAIGGGSSDESATYLWPQATVTKDCPESWPQNEGSYATVRYRDELREYDGMGGETYTMWDALIHTEYHGGHWIDETTWDGNAYWDGHCTERVTHMDANGVWTNVTTIHDWNWPPPMGIVPPGPVGQSVPIQTAGAGCQLIDFESTVIGRERRTFSIRSSSGDPVAIDAYHTGDSSTSFFADYWFDTRLGIMLDWHEHSSGQHHISSSRGWLLDTDAGFY